MTAGSSLYLAMARGSTRTCVCECTTHSTRAQTQANSEGCEERQRQTGGRSGRGAQLFLVVPGSLALDPRAQQAQLQRAQQLWRT